MHYLANHLLLLSTLLPLFSNHAYAGVNEYPVIAANEQSDLVNLARFRPRKYCRTRGGIVSETQNKDIYLCCYETRSKCVATDIKKSISWPIPYSNQSKSHFL